MLGNYQSPVASGPSWPREGHEPAAPKDAPSALLVYDSEGVLTSIAVPDPALPFIHVLEPISCEAPPANPLNTPWLSIPPSPPESSPQANGLTLRLPADIIRFQGREYDAETGLYYFRHRYYDPELGRFTQTDPMGYADSMNLYQAFNQSPMNFNDPMGLVTLLPGRTGLPYDVFETTNIEYGFAPTDYTIWAAYNTIWNAGALVGNLGANLIGGLDWLERDVLGLSQSDLDFLTLFSATNPGEINAFIQSLKIGKLQGTEKVREILQKAKQAGQAEGELAGTGPVLPNVRQGGYIRLQGPPSGGAANVATGKVGEEAVSADIGVPRNVGKGRVVVPGTGPGGFRIPDFPPGVTIRLRGSVVEVKNAQNLSISKQLRDLAAYAQSQGAILEIFSRAPAPLRGELADLVTAGVVKIRPMP